jgi:hypothetical protein
MLSFLRVKDDRTTFSRHAAGDAARRRSCASTGFDPDQARGRDPVTSSPWVACGIVLEEVALKAAIGMACMGLLLAGCASVGPPTITRDRFDYVSSISESWKRQMLLNLLKVRYADAPVFMDVSSVISSYSVEGDVSLSGQYALPGRGDTFGGVGAVGRYADKPTISYQPLAGDKFAKSMMAPIPVSGILYMIQSGYPADLVMRVCVSSVNGLDNAFGGPGNPRAGEAKYRELMDALRQSQALGETGFRVKPVNDKQATIMFMHPPKERAPASGSKVRELLGLNARAREFNVVYGTFPENDTEVAMMTRSVLQVITDFASYVEVPQADVAEGRVYSPQRTAEQERLFPPLLAVRHGDAAPEDAYAAIRYRNQWFWIDDRDQRSKLMMNALMLIFSLTEGAPAQAAPVVTIPAR